jgi:ABC-type sugar transport system substrate-binding protein
LPIVRGRICTGAVPSTKNLNVTIHIHIWRKEVKSRSWFILLFVLALVLAACGGEVADQVEEAVEEVAPTIEAAATEAADEEVMDEEGSIWVLLPDSASSARWETDDRRFFEAAFEEAGVEYNIVNAEGDARTQQTQAEQAITSGAKVILLVNLDSGSAAAIAPHRCPGRHARGSLAERRSDR